MEEIIHNFFGVITQVSPYIVVIGVFSLLEGFNKKRAKERKNRQRKGVIKMRYVVKSEKY